MNSNIVLNYSGQKLLNFIKLDEIHLGFQFLEYLTFVVALTLAPFSIKIWTILKFPINDASISEVYLSNLVAAFTLAPLSTNIWAILVWPFLEAQIRAV